MSRFDYFIVFAEMRTGSNFLEANINAFDGLECHGEAFNPHFIGYPNRSEILGVTQAMREADPQRLIEAVKTQSKGLGGFRFFNDHDPRVLESALPDPRCAKIILTRNPVDSYVSWKIAQATDQWKLTNVKNARTEKVRFDPAEFEIHLQALQDFQVLLLNALQTTGQTAFYVSYEDLQDVEVMNGLAAFLGCPNRIDALDKKLKKQNPAPHSDKVKNFDELESALAKMDRFDLSRTPNFEPRRAPVVPSYVAAPKTPLLYLPVRSGPEAAVTNWLSRLDDQDEDQLVRGFTQKSLRQWKRQNRGHRSFTVVRHPLARAHAAFCDLILPTGPGTYPEIRKSLRQVFSVPLPDGDPGPDYDRIAHRKAFAGFLRFLKANLGAQTSIRVDPHWASQSSVVQGFGYFASPDLIVREDRMRIDLAYLALTVGRDDAPDMTGRSDPHAPRLSEIYDEEIESLAADVYQRDYMVFGFGPWAP
ncbi:nodulation protein NodH [Loktanella sp. IMCC34160]|uniref:sulfotransferase family 2 domain-containing protein n=1 Tax=Loktanella sp. IMCC34160 TaxID=2510646 RepID=UPI00101BBEDA|nr:sulfotransferase family 2 domain-containing protein [Loktanella sp. IMCC34160]RYG91386.1 nodulation protein NodH [Loktanella sp. IMCC34160]